MDDVAVGATGWTINSVIYYYYLDTGTPPVSGTALLNIFWETGSLPTSADNPVSGTTVNITYNAIDSNLYTLTASGLNIILSPGDYWIGLTPDLATATAVLDVINDDEPVVGNPAAYINPGGGAGRGTGWQSASNLLTGFGDASFVITGSLSTPSAPEPDTLPETAGVLSALAYLRSRSRRARRSRGLP